MHEEIQETCCAAMLDLEGFVVVFLNKEIFTRKFVMSTSFEFLNDCSEKFAALYNQMAVRAGVLLAWRATVAAGPKFPLLRQSFG